jgi:hypothetical protein
MDVDVEVDVLDTCLWFPVLAAFAPGTATQCGVFDAREIETSPFAARRQLGAARPAELEGQDLLLAVPYAR